MSTEAHAVQKDKILLVEDEEETRSVLEKLLRLNNYEVKSAKNGSEALEIADSFIPKVVVADWIMPEMTGVELCDKLKNSEKHKLVYFILLTARATVKDRITGLDLGADDFLVKPVENQELLARIRSGVRIHNLQNELKKTEHNKALIEMAATIGHKINNPLSGLILSVKNIESEISEANLTKYKEDFYIINKSIERIAKFGNALKNLKNPQLIDYDSNSRILDV